MRKVNFRVRNFEKEQFLTFNIDNDASLDEELLDFLEEEEPRGIVPVIFEEEEEFDTFSYDITDKIHLVELSGQEVGAEMVLRVLHSLVMALIDMSEYRIPLSYLVLNRNYIYVDFDYHIEFICIPLEDMQEDADVNAFLRSLVANLRYDPSENGDYVAKLLTYINNRVLFNLRNMIALIEELMDEMGIELPEEESADIYVDYEDVLDLPDEEEEEDEIWPEVPEMTAYGEESGAEAVVGFDGVKEEQPEAGGYDAGEPEETAGLEGTEEEEPEESEAYGAGEPEETAGLEGTEEEEPEESEAYGAGEPEETTNFEEMEEEEPEESRDSVLKKTMETEDSGLKIILKEKKETGKEEDSDKIDRIAVPEEKSEEGQEIEDAEGSAEEGKKKKLIFKTKESENAGIVIKDELDDFLAEKEEEERLAKLHENMENNLKFRKNIKVSRAAVVRSTQEEINPDRQEQKEAESKAAETEKKEKKEEKKEAKKEAKREDKGFIFRKNTKAGQPADEKIPKEPEAVQEEGQAAELKTEEPASTVQLKVNPYLRRVNTKEMVVITKQVFKIGKASMGVDYTIKGNSAVSRVHAIIVCKGNAYYIQDHKSTNHTYVNGKMVLDGKEELLTDGCKIMLGNEEFLFKL